MRWDVSVTAAAARQATATDPNVDTADPRARDPPRAVRANANATKRMLRPISQVRYDTGSSIVITLHVLIAAPASTPTINGSFTATSQKCVVMMGSPKGLDYGSREPPLVVVIRGRTGAVLRGDGSRSHQYWRGSFFCCGQI